MKAIRNIYYYGQVVFSVAIDVWAIYMLLRCIFGGYDAFYSICFAAMTVSTWLLMVKPSWAELQEMKGGVK